MNSIDGALARIQEIMNRIHEIEAKMGRVSGYGPSAAPRVPAAQPGGGTVGASGAAGKAVPRASTGLTGAKRLEFQKLLEQAVSGAGSVTGTGGLSSSALLSGLGGLSNLGAVLGNTAGSAATNPLAGNSAALGQYQQQLLQAIRQLAAAQRAQNAGGAAPSNSRTQQVQPPDAPSPPETPHR